MPKIDLKNLDKADWKTYRFDQIVKNISERVEPGETDLEIYIGLEHIDAESVHIKRFGQPSDVEGQKLKCYPGDVIFGKRRAYQRKASVVTTEAICSAHAFVLRANPELIDPRLLPFFLHSDLFMHRAVDISAGGLSPTINWGVLKIQEFHLPPKEQQAELAELFWAMDEMIEKDLAVLDYTKIHKKSFVQSEIFNKSNDESWVIEKIGCLFDVKTGSKNAQDAVEFGSYPFFTRALETQFIDTFSYDQEALFLPGEGNYQIKYYQGKFDAHQRTYVFSKKDKPLLMQLYRDVIQDKVAELMQKSVGSTVNSLRKPIIENIKVPYIPIEVQNTLLSKIVKLDELESECESKISTAKALQKSLINEVF